jgi:hypothetical protein
MSRLSMTWALALAAILTGCDQSSPTYSTACATPLPNWKTEKDRVGVLLPIMPVFLVTDGSLLWNKVALSNDRLRRYMNEASALNPVPQIIL